MLSEILHSTGLGFFAPHMSKILHSTCFMYFCSIENTKQKGQFQETFRTKSAI